MRKDLLGSYQISSIDNLSDIDVFETAKVRTCILALNKCTKEQYQVEFINGTIDKGVYSRINSKDIVKDSLLENSNWLNIFYQEIEILELINKIRKDTVLLDSISESSQGLIPYDKYRGHSEETLKNRIWHANYKKDDTYRKELAGKDINRYTLNWGGKSWISYGEWLAAPRKKEFFTLPRLLIREITNPRILATITDEEYYNSPSIINVINIKDVDIYYVLGIINSKLISFYHTNTSPKAKKGLFPKILVNDVRRIPIKIINDSRRQQLIELVRQKLIETDNIELDKKIDEVVYSIYDIDNDQRQIVESSID